MTIARAQMNRQLYGIGNLVEREKYGLGSALKKFAKTFIPKELDPILQVAAPFLGPVYGPIASIAGSARTGKINPYSLAASTLPYVQFGGAGATGLESLIPTGYGGSGALGQFLPGGSLQVGSGTSLSNVLSDYMKVGTPSSTGNVSFEMGPEGLKLPGTTISDALSNKPMGTGDLFKTIFSPEASVDLGTRAKAAMDLTGSAIKAMYTNQDGSVDKRAVIATISAVPSYLDAKKKAQEAGLTDNEFNEQVYNQEKQFYANRYASNAPTSSFMRTTAQMGGIMNGLQQQQQEPIFPRLETLSENLGQAEQTLGQPSNQSNMSSITTAITGQQPQGFAEGGLLSIQLTPREGYFLGDLAVSSGVAVPVSGGQNINISGGGGLGGMIGKLIQQNPQMFKTQNTGSSISSMSDFIDIDPRDGIDDRSQKANGGRMDYAMGSEIPVRQNQQGTSELDLRAKGGYIPVGIKEKADDVPAMLSKNEFVFTADAVRGAGNGSINKGAQKMYKLMKSLEKKVKKNKVA
jgi:hypothetical protein